MLIKNRIEADENILAKLYYKRAAYTSTYNVLATPATYHYYFFATNKKLMGVFVDKYPELIELPYSRINGVEVVKEYSIDRSLVAVVLCMMLFGITYIVMTLIREIRFLFVVFLIDLIVIFIALKFIKKNLFYQLKGDLKRWERNFWRFPVNAENAEKMVSTINQMVR